MHNFAKLFYIIIFQVRNTTTSLCCNNKCEDTHWQEYIQEDIKNNNKDKKYSLRDLCKIKKCAETVCYCRGEKFFKDDDINDSKVVNASLMSSAQLALRVTHGDGINTLVILIYSFIRIILALSIFVERAIRLATDEKDRTKEDDDSFVWWKFGIIVGQLLVSSFSFISTIYTTYKYCKIKSNEKDEEKSSEEDSSKENSGKEDKQKDSCCKSYCDISCTSFSTILAIFLHLFVFLSLVTSMFELEAMRIRKRSSLATINTYNSRETNFVYADAILTIIDASIVLLVSVGIRLSLVWYFYKMGSKKETPTSMCCRFVAQAFYYIFCILQMTVTNILLITAVVLIFSKTYEETLEEKRKTTLIHAALSGVLKVPSEKMRADFWITIFIALLYPVISLLCFFMLNYRWIRDLSIWITTDKKESTPKTNCCRHFWHPFFAPVTSIMCFLHIASLLGFWAAFGLGNDILNVSTLKQVFFVAGMIASFINLYPLLVSLTTIVQIVISQYACLGSEWCSRNCSK